MVPPGLVDDVLPGLIRGGYASLKIFTTYDGFRLDDGAILEVFTTAAREGALVMVHAENELSSGGAPRICWRGACGRPVTSRRRGRPWPSGKPSIG